MITLLTAMHFPFSHPLAFKIAADTPTFADLRVHFFMAFTAFGEVARLAYFVAFIAFDRAAALTGRITK